MKKSYNYKINNDQFTGFDTMQVINLNQTSKQDTDKGYPVPPVSTLINGLYNFTFTNFSSSYVQCNSANIDDLTVKNLRFDSLNFNSVTGSSLQFTNANFVNATSQNISTSIVKYNNILQSLVYVPITSELQQNYIISLNTNTYILNLETVPTDSTYTFELSNETIIKGSQYNINIFMLNPLLNRNITVKIKVPLNTYVTDQTSGVTKLNRCLSTTPEYCTRTVLNTQNKYINYNMYIQILCTNNDSVVYTSLNSNYINYAETIHTNKIKNTDNQVNSDISIFTKDIERIRITDITTTVFNNLSTSKIGITSATIINLSGFNCSITNLTATTVTLSNFSTSNLNIVNLTNINCKSSNLVSTNGNIDNLISKNATVAEIKNSTLVSGKVSSSFLVNTAYYYNTDVNLLNLQYNIEYDDTTGNYLITTGFGNSYDTISPNTVQKFDKIVNCAYLAGFTSQNTTYTGSVNINVLTNKLAGINLQFICWGNFYNTRRFNAFIRNYVTSNRLEMIGTDNNGNKIYFVLDNTNPKQFIFNSQGFRYNFLFFNNNTFFFP